MADSVLIKREVTDVLAVRNMMEKIVKTEVMNTIIYDSIHCV